MDEALNQLVRLNSPLGYWLLGSVVAYALATNALWLATRRGLEFPPGAHWLVHAAQFLFYLGVPYLALGGWPQRPFSGLLLPEDLGLVGFGGVWTVNRWLQAVGSALGIGLGSALLLLIAWSSANRIAPEVHLRFCDQPWWSSLLNSLYLQAHWAFYRAALIVSSESLYIGTFAGLVLVYAEWGVNPFWRAGWRSERRAGLQWLRAALALVAAILFLWTQNFWVSLAMHAALEWAFRQVDRRRPLPQAAA